MYNAAVDSNCSAAANGHNCKDEHMVHHSGS